MVKCRKQLHKKYRYIGTDNMLVYIKSNKDRRVYINGAHIHTLSLLLSASKVVQLLHCEKHGFLNPSILSMK